MNWPGREWWATGAIILTLVVAAWWAWPRQRVMLRRDLVVSWLRALAQVTVLAGLLVLAVEDETWLVAAALGLVIWVFADHHTARRGIEALTSVGLEARLDLSWRLACAPVVMLPSALMVTLFAATGALPIEVLVLLPLLGMFSGHAMNAASQVARAFLRHAQDRRAELEQWILLGHSPAQATAAITGDTLTLALVPSLNSLATLGVVVIPGAMLGLLLAGVAPIEAARVQVLIMAGWIGSGWIGSSLMLRLLRRRLFDADARLLLPGRA